MSSTYPGTIDVFTNPGTATAISGTVSHAGQHSDANDAIEALEAKVGVSASTAVAGKILVGSGNGTTSWSNSITIPAAGNVTGLTVTQSDTTNNPKCAVFENDGTENGVYIQQDGVLANSKYGLVVISNAIQTNTSALVLVRQDNASSTAPCVIIDNDGTGHGLEVDQDGVLAASQYGLYVYSNAAQVNSPLVYIKQDNASSDKDCVYIANDGTGFIIKGYTGYGTNAGHLVGYSGGSSSLATGTWGGFSWLAVGADANRAALILGTGADGANMYLWVDDTGDLRIKNAAPDSDTDGTVVGTQS